MRASITERFERNFERIPGIQCWLWTAATSSNGYGHMSYKNKFHSAHRLSYEINVGSVPHGMCVLHHCDVRQCVNPLHLFIGTTKDNMADRNAKGRCAVASGEFNNSAKLTEEQVKEIRGDKRTGAVLSSIYGVSQSSVSRIRNRVNWK